LAATARKLQAVPLIPPPPLEVRGDPTLTEEAVASWNAGQRKCRARGRHRWDPYTVWEHHTYYDVVERCSSCKIRRSADYDKRGRCPSDQTYSNRKSLGGHLNREHRVTITDYEAVHGRVGGRLELQTGTPASNPEVGLPPPSDSVPDELRCGMDDCPVYYDPAIYARPHQALGVHRRMRHGVLGKGAQVADKGDAQ
jgi:hypothetical protein